MQKNEVVGHIKARQDADIAFRLTPLAIVKSLELQKDFPRYHNLPLRLYIEGKGCDGFTYGVSFDSAESTDHIFNLGQLTCIIDAETLMFCRGSTIDWVDDERGCGFLVENPHQKKFRGKFYKRKVWLEMFTKSKPKEDISELS